MGKNVASKVFMLGAILLVLCLGLFMVNGLVHDRQQYRETVVDGFAKGLAGRQTIGTPRLLLVCNDSWREQINDVPRDKEEIFYMHAVAEQAKIVSRVLVEPRTRGIYQVNTYQTKNTIEANWGRPHFVRQVAQTERIKNAAATTCGHTELVVDVADLRGIRDVAVKINGQSYLTETGTLSSNGQGFRVRLNSAEVKASEELKVSIELSLVGIEALDIAPNAAKNTVLVQANWPHPSFTGVLPDKRSITDKGFEANWTTSIYSVLAGNNRTNADRLGIAFVDPVNAYTQTDRAIKYGLLFIVLTFVAVGLFEVTKKLQVHPVQYLLVGSAVTIFFLLLLSLSEHLSFPLAYVLGATACVGLLTFYASHILGGLLRGTPFGGLMAVLYGMIYVLLSLEQTALLIGTLALFATLTAVIVLTRKINWYELGK